MASEWKCMLCGRWHKADSPILKRHMHQYYEAGGTFDLNRWETREPRRLKA